MTTPLEGHDHLWWREHEWERIYGDQGRYKTVVVYGCSCGEYFGQNKETFVTHCLSLLGANSVPKEK